MSSLLRDIRHAIRQLRKSPGFAIAAIVILALGIGANSAIFSILDSLLLRQLPVEHPEQLTWITSIGAYGTQQFSSSDVFKLYRQNSSSFSSIFAFSRQEKWIFVRNGQTTSADGEAVTGDYFSTLGVRPYLGRMITPEDERSFNTVAVLGYDYWRRLYGSSPKALGQTFVMNQTVYTIVGVAPPEFFGTVVGNSPELFIPIKESSTSVYSVVMMGRLKPGVSITQAQESLEPLFQQNLSQWNQTLSAKMPSAPAGLRMQIRSHCLVVDASHGISQLRTHLSAPLKILMGAASMVLLIACTNLTSLLVMRGMKRRKEFALRLALGSGRWTLFRGLLIESAILVTLGTGAGLLIASWGIPWMAKWIATDRMPDTVAVPPPIALSSGISGRVLIFTALLLGLTTFLCGFVPAFSAARLNLVSDLKASGDQTGFRRIRLGSALAAGQIAILVVLLFGTTMLLRSLLKLETADCGFDADHVLVVSIEHQYGATPEVTKAFDERRKSFYPQLLQKAAALPGVVAVSSSPSTPLSGREGAPIQLTVEGAPDPTILQPDVFPSFVSPGYFKTLGISMLRGRDFTQHDIPADGNNKFSIVNRTLARRLFGETSPIGKRFRMSVAPHEEQYYSEIVGVVEDSRFHDLREQMPAVIYFPQQTDMTIELRTAGNPALLVGPIRSLVHSIDGSIQIESIKTVRQQIRESLYRDRLLAAFCGGFSLLALALACIGLYGTISFDVTRRTSEIGVRIAVGATPWKVFRLIVGQGAMFSLAGLAFGTVVAAALAFLQRSLWFGADAFQNAPMTTGASSFLKIDKNFLFGVSPYDPATLVFVPLLVFLVTLIACYIPARRAASIEPMEALRSE